jgi:hypothetical protein
MHELKQRQWPYSPLMYHKQFIAEEY